MNVLCNNKKANFKYSFIKKLEAGLVLDGWEVKSLKNGNGQHVNHGLNKNGGTGLIVKKFRPGCYFIKVRQQVILN